MHHISTPICRPHVFQAFNAWLDSKLESGGPAVRGLLVYPEGTRSVAAAGLPLRRGMLYYAHSRRLPVQIIITAGKEDVLSEQRFEAAWGRVLVVGYGAVLQSADHDTCDGFVAAVQAEWDRLWAVVYGCSSAAAATATAATVNDARAVAASPPPPSSSGRRLQPLVQCPPVVSYPLGIKLRQAAVVAVSICLLASLPLRLLAPRLLAALPGGLLASHAAAGLMGLFAFFLTGAAVFRKRPDMAAAT